MPRSKNKPEATQSIESGWIKESHTGKGKALSWGQLVLSLLDEDLNSRYDVYCRHCQSPAQFLEYAPFPDMPTTSYCKHLRSFAWGLCLAAGVLLRPIWTDRLEVQEDIFWSNPQFNGPWELMFKYPCFLAPQVGHLCSISSHRGPQWERVPDVHSSHLLINTPCIGSLSFPV